MRDYKHITSRCFINIPFADFSRYRHLITKHLFQPEIGLEGNVLYDCSSKEFHDAANILKRLNLRCTLHAPFFDLAPGAMDRNVLQATRNKLKKAFELIPVFEPVSIVCHLGYEGNKHGYKKNAWLATAVETWKELLLIAEKYKTPIMLENTYETEPVHHREVLSALDSEFARFCLDVGHVSAFAKNTWQDWLPELDPWLGQLHIHDNQGDTDSHLAPGQGSFDFSGLFSYLREKKINPVITLEPHTETGVWESLEAIDKMGILN